jgi:hypothetical protein
MVETFPAQDKKLNQRPLIKAYYLYYHKNFMAKHTGAQNMCVHMHTFIHMHSTDFLFYSEKCFPCWEIQGLMTFFEAKVSII